MHMIHISVCSFPDSLQRLWLHYPSGRHRRHILYHQRRTGEEEGWQKNDGLIRRWKKRAISQEGKRERKGWGKVITELSWQASHWGSHVQCHQRGVTCQPITLPGPNVSKRDWCWCSWCVSQVPEDAIATPKSHMGGYYWYCFHSWRVRAHPLSPTVSFVMIMVSSSGFPHGLCYIKII